MFPMILASVLVVMLVMAVSGQLPNRRADDGVRPDLLRGTGSRDTLFVLIHGFNPDTERWNAVSKELRARGDVLVLRYDAGPLTNSEPSDVATNIGDAIGVATSDRQRPVVVIAHSMGALLARRAILDGLDRKMPWASQVQRLLLLAGMNRGWTVDGERAPDASVWLEFKLRTGAWLGRMMGKGEMLLKLERGAPFVSDLRLDWMTRMRGAAADGAKVPEMEVIQLLGDIDDFVKREDSEDLRAAAVGKFVLMRVRGTGHSAIIDINEDKELADGIGAYRKKKLLDAATLSFKELNAQNEELPPPVEPGVTDIVFVLHGIRDLGEWSSKFESQLRDMYPGRAENLRIVSPRYGYLGMGPFLFDGVRDRYVRWFMDQYTETLARYPKVKPENIRFFGHSNGTYLLAAALHKYKAIKIGRVVLAGSVVPSDYGWSNLGDRVGAIQSYAGTHDLVVALFPRLFELPGMRIFHNRVGGAGFHGFTDPKVENILVDGAHSAFDGHEKEIVQFLMDDLPPKAFSVAGPDQWKERRALWERALGSVVVVLFVWTLIVALVVYLGVRVVGAASSPSWPILVAYALLIVTLLRIA